MFSRSLQLRRSVVDISGNIGFIGIGNMGSRMAMNVLQKSKGGGTLFVFDRKTSTDGYSKLVQRGAVSAESAREIARNCQIIFSMLPSSQNVRDLYMEEVFPSLKAPSLLIDCSTIDPGTARFLQAESENAGHLMMDAPVSGGVGGAEAGTLTFMVGTSLSESDFFSSFKSLFDPMGKAVYCGGPGVGQSVKICNNLILAAQMLGVAEGYQLAHKLGVDLKKFNDIVNSSTGQSWTSTKYNPVPGLMENVPASRDYKGGFMTDLMIKDLGLAVEAAKSVGKKVPVTEFSLHEYSKGSQKGMAALDFGSIYKLYDV